MQVAIITKTKVQVEIVSVSHGWTTVRELGQSTTFKVRNGQLGGHTTMSANIVREYKASGAGPVAAAKAAKVADASERKNGKVDALYLPQYEVYSAVRADGTKVRSIDKGDAVAVWLRGQDLATTYRDVASATGLSVVDLTERFQHLNPGMQRMNLGNMLRRTVRQSATA